VCFFGSILLDGSAVVEGLGTAQSEALHVAGFAVTTLDG